MLTVAVFGPWRPVWDAVLGSSIQRLDELARERQKGRNAPPQVAPEVLQLVTADQVQAVLRGARLPQAADFLRVMQDLAPLLRACVWPRWLLLEAALDEASISGALHLSALILRAQIEELDALRVVAAVLEPMRHASWDEGALAAAINTLNDRVLPRLQTRTPEQLLDPAHNRAAFGSRPDSL